MMNDHDGPRRRTVKIAAAIVYLASPASTYVTGVILSIEGGYTAW
jgi:NAD(P)-dependent dehydrogenase (short-subunit alcohol dehydrogenase family)